MTPTEWADKPTEAAGVPVRQHSTPVKQRLLAVSQTDDPRKITRSIQVLDQEVVDDLAQMIEAVIEDFRQAAGKLTEMLDQAQHSRGEAEEASAKLEQRLGLGVRLLKGLEERTKIIGAATADLDEQQHRTEEAEARLQQQFADFDNRLDAAAARFEQQTTNTSEAMLNRASAVTQIAENAEINVALMARGIGEALAEVRQKAQIDALPQAGPPAVIDVEDPPTRHETGLVSSSDRSMDDLISSKTGLEGELNALSARCDRLKRARQTALGSQASPNQFLREMSSELLTPLDGVMSMFELLGDTELDHEQQRYLKAAEYAVAALSSLLGVVLDLPRIEDKRIALDSSEFDLRSTVEQAVEMLVPSASKKGIVLSHTVDGDVPPVACGDARRLRQVLLYSMSRAIRIAQQGEVWLAVTLYQRTDTETTVRFQLTHEGSSIPELDHSASVQDEVGPESRGGFGLTIPGKLVELMGGDFGVETDEDQPSFIIWFTVPLAKPSASSHDRRAHARLTQEALQCSLGEIIDLSLGGMQVRCARMPKDKVIEVELIHQTETIKLKVEVMRSTKTGFRKHEIGLRFLDVDQDTAKLLSGISLDHWVRRTLGDK